MRKKKLHRIKLVPTSIMPASYFEMMCQMFQLDPKKDYHATKKMRVLYRPCHQQLLVF